MKSWSLSRKIWSIVGGLSFVFVLSTAMNLHGIGGLRDDLNELSGPIVRRDQLTSEIKDNQRRLNLNAVETIVFTKDDDLKRNQKEYEEVLAKMDVDLAAYEALASEEGKKIAKRYRELYATYLVELKRSREYGLKNMNEPATVAYINLRLNQVPAMRKELDAMNDLTAKVLAGKTADANATAQRTLWSSAVFALTSILASLIVAYFVLRALTRTIADVVSSLIEGANQGAAASNQVAAASEQLSQATTEQAASLEETAASIEEMNSMVAKSTESAITTSTTADKSKEMVGEGQRIIDRMKESMTAINRGAEKMGDVVQVIEQIEKKTKVINDIVNKTELLSFNASVEAARAGEHGKGFAVVAEEVGNLARMSGIAAEEITALLDRSLSTVQAMVGDTKQSVSSGLQITNECGVIFGRIVTDVTGVSELAGEIASASREQSRGVAEITKAMSQLDQMTQQNAATSEECAAAAEELSAQSVMLKNTIGQLVKTVNGDDGSAPEALEAPTSAKVITMKTRAPRPSPAPAGTVPRRAVGAPSYDSSGFSDV